jgi:hypothetical protein
MRNNHVRMYRLLVGLKMIMYELIEENTMSLKVSH